MYTLALAVLGIILSTVMGYESYTHFDNSLIRSNVSQQAAQTAAQQFALYREAVETYAVENPGFVGSVPTGDLNLPPTVTWDPSWGNYIRSTGTAFVWFGGGSGQASSGQIASYLSKNAHGSFLVGLNSGGYFQPLLPGMVYSNPLPTAIPSGSVVSIYKNSQTANRTQASPTGPPDLYSPYGTQNTNSYQFYDGQTQSVCQGWSKESVCTKSKRVCRWHAHLCYTCCHMSCVSYRTEYVCTGGWQQQYQWATNTCQTLTPPGGGTPVPEGCTASNYYWSTSP